MTRVTFGDVCGSPATPPERALSVAASCSLRELLRLRLRASQIADPLARARSAVLSLLFLIKQPPRGLLQKTQTTKFPDLAVVARTPFWSFCAGHRRIGPGQITDGT